MALDPRIALMGQPVNVAGAIQGGIQQGEALKQRSFRDQILSQQAQQGAINIATQQGAYINQLATGLMELPLDQRASVMAQQIPALSQLGIPASQALGTDLTDQGLRNVITQTQPLIAKAQGGSSGFQFGATQTVQKPDGSLVSITQVRDPSTGGVRVVETPIQGELVSGIGETAEERKKREIQTAVEKTTGTGEAETGVLAEREEVLRPGEVATAEALSQVAIGEAAAKQEEQIRQTRASARKTEFSDQLQMAASALPRLTEAFKLAQVADQGLIGAGRLQLAKILPNIDVTDSAALDSALTTLALDELQKFKGPTTDFEFGVTQNISGQLIGSQKANLARIAALQRNNWFLQREAEQFNNWVDAGGDPDRFAFNFTEVMPTQKGDFTLKQIQDTAVANSMSIEQVLEALNQ